MSALSLLTLVPIKRVGPSQQVLGIIAERPYLNCLKQRQNYVKPSGRHGLCAALTLVDDANSVAHHHLQAAEDGLLVRIRPPTQGINIAS
jgi:hypothetical protein